MSEPTYDAATIEAQIRATPRSAWALAWHVMRCGNLPAWHPHRRRGPRGLAALAAHVAAHRALADRDYARERSYHRTYCGWRRALAYAAAERLRGRLREHEHTDDCLGVAGDARCQADDFGCRMRRDTFAVAAWRRHEAVAASEREEALS